MQRPRLRDNNLNREYELYPLGAIPDTIIRNIGKWVVYNFIVGKHDINGEDWGDIFAKAIDGVHLNKPIGLADVILDGMGWLWTISIKMAIHYSYTMEIILRCIPARSMT